jgi:aflavarin biosynthesis cytochrome P450 monooxygenase
MIPSRYIHLDPENYPDPIKFDPYRFYDPVSGTCDARATITPTDKWIAFGIGTSTCPARILGLRTTQLIVAKIVLSYDFAPMEPAQKEVPLMYFFGSNAGPNEDITMRIRNRQVDEPKK